MSLRARVFPGLFLAACGPRAPEVDLAVPVEASPPPAPLAPVAALSAPSPERPAPPMTWLEEREQAMARGVRDGKPVLVFVVASWQPRTQFLDRTVWSDDDVRRAASDVVAVRVDVSDPGDEVLEHWLTERGIDHVPAVGLLHPGGTVLGALTGPEVSKTQVLRLLRRP